MFQRIEEQELKHESIPIYKVKFCNYSNAILGCNWGFLLNNADYWNVVD